MRKGCIITVAILGLLLMGIAYGVYRLSTTVMDVPEYLEPFKDGEKALAMIRSKAPAPPDSARLTPEDVDLYMRGLDSVSAGWRPLRRMLDSLVRSGDFSTTDTGLSMLKNLDLLHEFILFIPRTNAGLVHYLNSNGISAARYGWLRRRIIAASGITRETVRQRSADSLINTLDVLLDSKATDEAYSPSYPPDSTEKALVEPVRERILREGFMSLVYVESFLLSPSKDRVDIRID